MRLPSLLVLILVVLAGPAFAQAVQVPGSSWTITPPEGFKLVRKPVTMFVNAQKVVISITDFDKQPVSPEKFGVVGKDFDEGTANEGNLQGTETLEVNGRPAVLAFIRLKGRKTDSITLVIEGQRTNALVSVGIPDAAKDADRDAIRAALMTVQEVNRTDEDKLADLPYKIGDMADFRLTDIGMGSVATLTDGPGDSQAAAPEQAYVTVMGADTGGQQLNYDRDSAPARQRLLQQYPDADIKSVIQQETSAGTALVIAYTRALKDTQITLQGEAWFRMAGPMLVLVISEYPEGTAEVADRIIRLKESITPR